MTKWAARKAAQKAVKLEKCERCGATLRLQRHHPDITKYVDVTVLCQKCHVAVHMAEGTWGASPKPSQVCVICNRRFLPNDSHPHKTCGAACLSELGRRLAMKRWHPESSACTPSETPSCPKSPSGLADES